MTIDSLHVWLKNSPIALIVLGIILSSLLTPILSPVVTTFWRFVQIPPQRLNVWILKARLDKTARELKENERLQSDIRYFVYCCLICVFVFLGAIICMSFAILLATQIGITATKSAANATSLKQQVLEFSFLSFMLIFVAWTQLQKISAIATNCEKTNARCTRKLEKLQIKLESKTTRFTRSTLL